MGKAVESQAKAAARMRLQPCSIFTTIISTAMIASSTSRPSAMMSEPSVMRSRLSPATFMTTSTTASTSGTDVATTRPERHPSEMKLTTSTMASASTNERRNSLTDSSTTRGWSVIWSISTPVGTCALASAIASLSRLPSSRTLAPLVMATTTPTASLPLWRTMLLGGSSYPRLTVAISPSRKVTPPASMGTSAMAASPLNAPVTRTSMRSALVSMRARGRHGILARHAVENGLGRDAERRQLAVAELDEDALLAHADDVDLGDALRAQQALAHDLRIILELGERDVGARQHVDGGVDVAVLVVEEGPCTPCGSVGRLSLSFLRTWYQASSTSFCPRRILELHLNDGDARPRVGLDVVEKLELLQALLELVGDLILHLLGGGAGPCCADDHRLDRERGILGAAEVEVAHEPRHREHDDEEQHERGMLRPPRRRDCRARRGVRALRAWSLHHLDDADGDSGVELVNARRYDLLARREPAGDDGRRFGPSS